MPDVNSSREPAADIETESATVADTTQAAPPLELTPEQLAESIELAEDALREITEFNFIGDFHDVVDEGDGIYSLRFVSNSPGFRDWWWTAALTRIDGADAPTVLECGLLPGEDALLAPEWVPWAKRLARFRATHDSHGNLLPEADEQAEGDAEASPRSRTRKRTRTRLRRRGESVKTEDAVDSDSDTDTDADTEGDSVPGDEERAATTDRAATHTNSDDVISGAEESKQDEQKHGEQKQSGGAKAKSRTRRRVRPAMNASSATKEELPVAPDIRDYAEEMDEALDGVSFEETDTDDESGR
ncbi:DUF3027 domain-containing protein [Gulosibacter molinativorax]|nr:DUF3027 domain-containing protein [Gulosibacter molinativorax]